MNKLVIALVLTSVVCFGFTFKFDGWIERDATGPTDMAKFGVVVPFMGTSFTASGGFKRDNIVIPPEGYAEQLWNNYWFWDEGYFEWKNDQLLIEAGVKQHSVGPGEIYKLFVAENGFSYPSVHSIATLGRFRVETLWGGLRFVETDTNPLKGFNYRALIFSPFDGFEIAYQESVLYLKRFFDPYYYFVPIPAPGIQEFWHLPAPWQYSTEEMDDNSMIGAYMKYSASKFSVYADLLVDDINMNRFLKPDDPHPNPDKIAFMVGFSGKSGPYKLTIEVAGATAFTFERTHLDMPYEYVYFEGTNLPIEKNMIGYLHSENNIACSIALEYSDNGWSVSGVYEGLIYGTRTPDKPWHGGSRPSGTHWLIGDVKAQYSFKGRIGYTFGALQPYLGQKLAVGFRFGFVGERPFFGFDLSAAFDVDM